ncbi:hypothetical protein ScKU66_12080 [Streptococcus canis]|nr:hypothetical protein SpKU43_13770 [Streptococcus canis]GMX38836.1 hypothetical protein ScKU71_00590 [Streptococcus canis]
MTLLIRPRLKSTVIPSLESLKFPIKKTCLSRPMDFSFALDERGIVFIDEHRHVADILAQIQVSKK